MSKKLISILLVAVVCLTFASCSSDKGSSSSSGDDLFSESRNDKTSTIKKGDDADSPDLKTLSGPNALRQAMSIVTITLTNQKLSDYTGLDFTGQGETSLNAIEPEIQWGVDLLNLQSPVNSVAYVMLSPDELILQSKDSSNLCYFVHLYRDDTPSQYGYAKTDPVSQYCPADPGGDGGHDFTAEDAIGWGLAGA